jgi:hypothetical protein
MEEPILEENETNNTFQELKKVVEFQQEVSVYICITKQSHVATCFQNSQENISTIISEDREMLERTNHYFSVLKNIYNNVILFSDEFQVVQDMMYEYEICQSFLQVAIKELECESERNESNYSITLDSLVRMVVSKSAFPWITLKERAHEIHDSVISQPLRIKIVTSPNTRITGVSKVTLHLKEFIIGKGWVTPQQHSSIDWNPAFSNIDLENGDITIRIEVGKDYCFSSKLSVRYEAELTVVRQSAMGNVFEYQVTTCTEEIEDFYILSHQKRWFNASASVIHLLVRRSPHELETNKAKKEEKRIK